MRYRYYLSLVAIACLLTSCKTMDTIREKVPALFGNSSSTQDTASSTTDSATPATPKLPEITSDTEPLNYVSQLLDYTFKDSWRFNVNNGPRNGGFEIDADYRVPKEVLYTDRIQELRKSVGLLCMSKNGYYHQDSGACVAQDGKNMFVVNVQTYNWEDIAVTCHFPATGKSYLDSSWQGHVLDYLRQVRNSQYSKEGWRKACSKMPVTAFGLTIDKSTLSEFKKKYPTASLVGFNHGANGGKYSVPPKNIKFKGLKKFEVYFNPITNKLRSIKAVLPINDYDRVYKALKKKYKIDTSYPVTVTFEREDGSLGTSTSEYLVFESYPGVGGVIINYCNSRISLLKSSKDPSIFRLEYTSGR